MRQSYVSMSAEEKLAAIQPAVLSSAMLTQENTLVLDGWAQVNGGQAKHYWSIDKLHWYECTGATFSDVDQSILDKATNEGNMKAPSAENGRFAGLTVDLSKEEGEEFTLYLAVAAAGNGEKLLHYLTVEKLTRYTEATEPETEAPTEPETTEAPTEQPTEPETTEAPTEEETTEAATTAPAEETTVEAQGGCGSVVTVSVGVLLTAVAATVALCKKRD